jgi:hypothetical protein
MHLAVTSAFRDRQATARTDTGASATHELFLTADLSETGVSLYVNPVQVTS